MENTNNTGISNEANSVKLSDGLAGNLPAGEREFTDRYKALGIPYPNVDTMCKGQCEGTGWVPVAKEDMEEPYIHYGSKPKQRSRLMMDGIL
jgi:hypothetical protein